MKKEESLILCLRIISLRPAVVALWPCLWPHPIIAARVYLRLFSQEGVSESGFLFSMHHF